MKFFLIFITLISLYAKDIVNEIAIIVNGNSITTYDINKTQKQLHINKDQAISYLIDQAVFKSLLKKENIYVDNFDIDKAMYKIAKQNGMSVYEFKQYLAQKGKLQPFINELRQKIEKEKILKKLHVNVSKEEIQAYYKQHLRDYIRPSEIEVTQYSSPNKNSLLQIIKNPLANVADVKVKNLTLKTDETNPCLINFLEKFPNKSFSTIFKEGNKYLVFYIISKGDNKPLPLKMVIDKIYQKLMTKKANETFKDLLAKERAKADIQFVGLKNKGK